MKIKKILLTCMAFATLTSSFSLSAFAQSDAHNVKTENGVIATFVEKDGQISSGRASYSMMGTSNLVWNHNGYTTSCTPNCCNRRNDVVVAETTCKDNAGNDKYHYSRARKERNGNVVSGTDSGRVFGTGSSKATSPCYDPYTPGIAKTYYGEN